MFVIFLIFAAAAAFFLQWSRKSVVTTEYSVESERIPAEFDGFRIVQVSDLQSEYFGRGQKNLLEKVRRANPDMIVFTGDLADRNHTDYQASLTAIEGLVRISPVYYVNGNHELALAQEEISQMYDLMKSVGAVLLFDETAVIEKKGVALHLMGLSEETLCESKLRGRFGAGGEAGAEGCIEKNGAVKLERKVQETETENGEGSGAVFGRKKISDTDIDTSVITDKMKELEEGFSPEECFSILLVHEPQFLETYARGGFDLIFAGHAHGGQIRLPFTQGLFAPGQGILPPLTAGVHTCGKKKMVISRGLGNSTFPFRLFNRPEIVSVKLVKKEV